MDLYESGFYSEPNVNLRGHMLATVQKFFYARVIGILWYVSRHACPSSLTVSRKLEGTSIRESWMLDGATCDQDRRGSAKSRVCFEERPSHVYYVDAVEEAMNELPSAAKLNMLIDDSHKLDLRSTFVERDAHNRSSVRRSSDRHTELLLRYGEVPGAILLPICCSWYGEATSDIDSGHNTNGPCLCDPPALRLAARWCDTTNYTSMYTERFILGWEFQNMPEYAKMCRGHNECEKDGKWPPKLALYPDEVAPEMQDAWTSYKHPRGHGENEPSSKSPTVDEPAVGTQTKHVLNPMLPAAIIAAAPSITTSPPVFTRLYYAVGGSTTTVTVLGDLETLYFPHTTEVRTVSRPYETVTVNCLVADGFTRLDVSTITVATPIPTV